MIKKIVSVIIKNGDVTSEILFRKLNEVIDCINKMSESDKGRNPAHYCMNCDKYLGFRGFCSKKCHDEWYDSLYPKEEKKTLSDKIADKTIEINAKNEDLELHEVNDIIWYIEEYIKKSINEILKLTYDMKPSEERAMIQKGIMRITGKRLIE